MALPSTMRVCEVTEFGGPEVLQAGERPWPVARDGEVVVAIEAANVNPTDTATRSGAARRRMPDLQPPFVPGWDLAGEVGEVGAPDSGYAIGDPVVGMIPFGRIGGRVGAYAQAAAVQPDWLAPRPEGLDEVHGATVPLNALTAHQALESIAAPAGAAVLITGASGAVGSFATQLATQRGIRVVALASYDDEAWVGGLGANQVLRRGTDLSKIDPVDALLDAVPLGAQALAPVRRGGVAVFTRGSVELPDELEVRVEKPLVHSDPEALAELTRMVGEGRLRSRLDRTLDLARAAEAHRLVERGGLRGKVVLTTR